MTMRNFFYSNDNLNKSNQNGVTIIEVLLVIACLMFLVLIINNIPPSISSINKSRHQAIARDIVNKELETLRKQGYANLANGLVNFSDTNLTKLPTPSATVDIENCPVSICTLSEKLKSVVVTVTWYESGAIKNIQMTTLIGQGGLN